MLHDSFGRLLELENVLGHHIELLSSRSISTHVQNRLVTRTEPIPLL